MFWTWQVKRGLSNLIFSVDFSMLKIYNPSPFSNILVKCKIWLCAKPGFWSSILRYFCPTKSSSCENFGWRRCIWFAVRPPPPNQKSSLSLWCKMRWKNSPHTQVGLYYSYKKQEYRVGQKKLSYVKTLLMQCCFSFPHGWSKFRSWFSCHLSRIKDRKK